MSKEGRQGRREGGEMSSIEMPLHQIIVERLAMTFGDRELSCSYNYLADNGMVSSLPEQIKDR